MGTTLTGETPSAALPLPIPPHQPPKSVCIPSDPSAALEAINHTPGPDATDSDWDCTDPPYDAPQNPDTPRYHAPTPTADSDEDDEIQAQMVPRRKPGGYDSRVEQILYENPELPILITDAGKSVESGGRYIVYTIRTGVRLPLLRIIWTHPTDNRV